MSKLGYRKREPNEPPREHPKMLREMINFHRHSLDYTDEDIANVLCVTLDEFRKLYQFEPREKPRLRVVN